LIFTAKKLPDIIGYICNYKFKELDFDFVILAEVLEHVHSPHKAIENIKNALKPNGRLLITVPFIFPIHDLPHD